MDTPKELIDSLRSCVNLMWARGANVCDSEYPSADEVANALLPREREIFIRAREVLKKYA